MGFVQGGKLMDTVDAVAAHRPYGLDCKCGRAINSDADWAQHLIDALRLTEEHQWVPITESGRRWQPRDKGLAAAALDLYGTSGSLQVVEEHGDPLSHIEHESRLVSEWVRKDNTNE